MHLRSGFAGAFFISKSAMGEMDQNSQKPGFTVMSVPAQTCQNSSKIDGDVHPPKLEI
jgi:hypothetical protein